MNMFGIICLFGLIAVAVFVVRHMWFKLRRRERIIYQSPAFIQMRLGDARQTIALIERILAERKAVRASVAEELRGLDQAAMTILSRRVPDTEIPWDQLMRYIQNYPPVDQDDPPSS